MHATVDTVEEMASSIEQVTRGAAGDSPAAERVLRIVRDQARRTRHLLTR